MEGTLWEGGGGLWEGEGERERVLTNGDQSVAVVMCICVM